MPKAAQRFDGRRILLALAAALSVGAPGVPSASAGPPFRTDDPEPVEYRHWEAYGFSQATRAGADLNGALFGVEVNYGAAPDLQLNLVVPLAFDERSGSATQSGLGDTDLAAKYRFVQEDERGWRPMIAIFPLLEVPTGDARHGLGSGHLREFLPLWLQKSFGDWQSYGGGGYWINPGAGNRNYWFAGWLLQRKITERLTLGGELFHQTADTFGGSDSTGFNFGGLYDLTENHHLVFSAGRGIQNAEGANRYSYYVAYRLTL